MAVSRKPSPGVCGHCGRARVRPTPQELERALDLAALAGRGDAWTNGHHYVEGKLVEVRCIDHEPREGWDWWD